MKTAADRAFEQAVARAGGLTLDARLATSSAARLATTRGRLRELDRALGALHTAQRHQFNAVQDQPPCPRPPQQLQLL